MAAYIVFISELTRDPAELQIYSQKAPAGLIGHPVTPLAMYGPHEVIEDPQIEGMAILAFPSFAEAKAWYDSPAYREALQHRLHGGDYRGVIVEGL